MTRLQLLLTGLGIAGMALLSAFFAVASGQFLDRPLFVALLLVGGVAVAVFLWLMPAASRTAGLSGTPAEHDRETSGGGDFSRRL